MMNASFIATVFGVSALTLAGAGAQAPATASEPMMMSSEPVTGAPAEPAATTAAEEASTEQARGSGVEEVLRNPEWTIQIEPSIWFVSPSGKFSLPAENFATKGDKLKIEDLNLDTPLISPYGEVNIRGGDTGQWRFSFSAGDYASDREATAETDFRLGDVEALAGDPLGVSFDFFAAEATVGYRFFEYDFREKSERPEDAARLLFSSFVYGGVRVYDVDIEVDNRAMTRLAESGTHQFFAEPILGVRNEIEIAGDFSIDQVLSFGGMPLDDHSSYSVDIAVGFMYRPHPNIAAQIGWRQIAFWLSDGEDDAADEFEYNGRLAGLYFGFGLRF